MCTLPHPVAVRAHCMFMETNLGDPGLFLGTAALEKLLIERLGTLFHCKEAGGYATSGGTESNIQALRLAKALKKEVVYPNIVVPESAHFSFRKACDLLCLEMRTVPLGEDYRMDGQKAAEQVDKNTVCLVGIAGTTEYGMIDPIADLARIAVAHDIFFHVDAAFGGMVIPFLKNPVPFDFSLPGRCIHCSRPPQDGPDTIPAGCLLTRDSDILQNLNHRYPVSLGKTGVHARGDPPGSSRCGSACRPRLSWSGRDAGSRFRMHEKYRAPDCPVWKPSASPGSLLLTLMWRPLPAGMYQNPGKSRGHDRDTSG